jgi:methylglutaconyl-CoA hydratase
MVLVRDQGPVRWLTLNRADKRNALSAELVGALDAALDDTGDARCLAITGAGTVFSAGADLAALQDMQTASFERNLEDSRRLAALFEKIASHALPIVAAVNGHAIAGGAGLAVACDAAFMTDDAVLGFTEVRIGFVPAIVLNFLLRTTGERAVRDLCLTGRRIGAHDAALLGLVNEALPASGVVAAVARFGDDVALASPEAVAETNRLLLDLYARPRADGLRDAAEANARARATADCREGNAPFLEKRKPNWVREEKS